MVLVENILSRISLFISGSDIVAVTGCRSCDGIRRVYHWRDVAYRACELFTSISMHITCCVCRRRSTNNVQAGDLNILLVQTTARTRENSLSFSNVTDVACIGGSIVREQSICSAWIWRHFTYLAGRCLPVGRHGPASRTI